MEKSSYLLRVSEKWNQDMASGNFTAEPGCQPLAHTPLPLNERRETMALSFPFLTVGGAICQFGNV